MQSGEELRHKALSVLSSLQLPPTWRLEGYDSVRLTTDHESDIQSIGAIYTDMSTSGIKLKKYRICYHVTSEHLSIAEKTIIDYGKFSFSCLTSNNTVVQMNQYITEKLQCNEQDN